MKLNQLNVGDKVKRVRPARNNSDLSWENCTLEILKINGDDITVKIYLQDGSVYWNRTNLSNEYWGDAFELIETKYDNFSVKGSFVQLTAFIESVNELGWKWNNQNESTTLTAEEYKSSRGCRHLCFKVKNCALNPGEYGYYSDTHSTIFNLPTQFTEAFMYAKEALESIQTKEIMLTIGDGVVFTIRGGVANCKFGTVTTKDMVKIADFYKSRPSILGHKLEFEMFRIGCQPFKLSEAQELLKALKDTEV